MKTSRTRRLTMLGVAPAMGKHGVHAPAPTRPALPASTRYSFVAEKSGEALASQKRRVER